MAITAYTDVLPVMRTRLPDCSDNLILQALWEAGREFCVETEAYIQALTAINAVADRKEYTLSIPTGFDPIRVFDVRTRTEDEVTDGDKGTLVDPSKYDFHIFTNVLEFVNAPFVEGITGGLVVRLVLAPQEDTADTVLDFDFMRRWMHYIKAGAFFRLFGMEESRWYSEGKAGENYAVFRQGVAYARREVKVQGTTRELRLAGGSFL
jgi:hypothetical protein